MELERQRRAQERWHLFEDLTIADQADQGREYKRGQNDPPPKPGDAHYDLTRLNEHRARLMQAAFPDQFTDEALRERAVQQNEAKWDAMDGLLGRAFTA